MQNRRNFYRILQVQPDAPTAAIKNNYRILLQKLRLHPDLGGDPAYAGLVNQAWQTLRDPAQRRSYDKQLLQTYSIQAISQGHLSGKSDINQARILSGRVNQRNYYRILNVQTDAPAAIICASYRHLLKTPHIPAELFQEAYAILSDPEKRKNYDKFLKNHTHINALRKEKVGEEISLAHIGRITGRGSAFAVSSNPSGNANNPPTIIQYCKFCKTPYSNRHPDYYFACCIECGSPLHGMPETQSQRPQRTLSRIDRKEELEVYIDWPGHGHRATLTNLSPGGLGFITSQALRPGQIIKVNGEYFKCIAKILHCQNNVTGKTVGSCFITVLFDRQQGTFIATRA